jgi:hypothetical protein
LYPHYRILLAFKKESPATPVLGMTGPGAYFRFLPESDRLRLQVPDCVRDRTLPLVGPVLTFGPFPKMLII